MQDMVWEPSPAPAACRLVRINTSDMVGSVSLSVLGRYRLERRLGRGGMAEVFAAEHCGAAGFERPVCIKRILPDLTADEDFRRLFVREARVAGRLTHANIVQVFDCIEDGRSLAIVMELVDGLDLRDLIRKLRQGGERLPEPLVAHVAGQLLAGLGFAHRQQVVHRDVSPHNVMISREGEVKLADFGVAKVMITIYETKTGDLKGKVPYMSPEQVRGKKDIDGRTDLYSAGLVLYELLRGERFFEESSYGELVGSVINAERPVLTGTSPELAALVETLLEPDREKRFHSAEQALAALPSWPESGPQGALFLGEIVRRLVDSEASLQPSPEPGELTGEDSDSAQFDTTASACDDGFLTAGDTKIDRGGTKILPDKPKLQARLDRPVIPGDPKAITAPREDDVEIALANAPTTENEVFDGHDTVETRTISELRSQPPRTARGGSDQPSRSRVSALVVVAVSCCVALLIALALWLVGPLWLEARAPVPSSEVTGPTTESRELDEQDSHAPASSGAIDVAPDSRPAVRAAAAVGNTPHRPEGESAVTKNRQKNRQAGLEEMGSKRDAACEGEGCRESAKLGVSPVGEPANDSAGEVQDAGSVSAIAEETDREIEDAEDRPRRRVNIERRKNRESSGNPATRPFDGNPFARGRGHRDRR